jgi:hypothetical protein
VAPRPVRNAVGRRLARTLGSTNSLMQSSFNLPRQAVHRTLRRYSASLALLLAFLILPGFLTTGAVAVSALLVSTGAALALYTIARTFTWVTINAEGIHGSLLPSSSRIKLAWNDDLIIRTNSYIGLPCIELVTRDGSQSIRVPTEITRSAAFHKAVSRFAPPSHPLRKLSAGAA